MAELTRAQRAWRSLPIVRSSREWAWEGWRAEGWFAVGEVLAIVMQAFADAGNSLERVAVAINERRGAARTVSRARA